MTPKRSPLQWLASTGSVLALLAPKGLCPICVAASGGVLSSIGLGFLAVDSVIQWILPTVLFVGLAGLFLAARHHRHWWVLGLGVGSAFILYTGWLMALKPVLYSGMALLFAASLLNSWSQRHPRVAFDQIPTERKVSHG